MYAVAKKHRVGNLLVVLAHPYDFAIGSPTRYDELRMAQFVTEAEALAAAQECEALNGNEFVVVRVLSGAEREDCIALDAEYTRRMQESFDLIWLTSFDLWWRDELRKRGWLRSNE